MATKKADHKAKDHQNVPDTAASADQSKILQNLDYLSALLKDDLSSVDLDAGLEIIGEWHKLLKETKAPQSQEIASKLKELQKLLKQGNMVGHDLGELLSHLGEQTSDLAAKAEKELKNPLQHLGQQLTKSGKSLVKTESNQLLEALDELAEMLDEDVDEIDSESATQEIDYWYGLLQKSEDQDIKEIATDLKELRKLIGGNKTKADELSQQLIQLGEQTIDVADNAAKGFKGVIKTIGKALVKLGESIE